MAAERAVAATLISRDVCRLAHAKPGTLTRRIGALQPGVLAPASDVSKGLKPCSARRRSDANCAGVSGALRLSARASARVKSGAAPPLGRFAIV
jgi:hypothetical protein